MRKDIMMDIDSGDIATLNRLPAYSSDLIWTTEDDTYVYGDCVLKDYLNFSNLNGGIGVNIPRYDSIKKAKVRFSIVNGRGDTEDTGYNCVIDLSGECVSCVKLPLISNKMYFRFYLNSDDGSFTVTNGYVSDMEISTSIDQNEYFLLTANPGNIYNNPLTGVGIVKYLNSNIRKSDLPQKIQKEYDLDGMTVTSIEYDEDNDEIETKSKEK